MASESEQSKLVTKLSEIYSNPKDPGSFGGIDRLWKSARLKGVDVSRKGVEEYLKSNDTYTLHRGARTHYSRNPTIVGGIDHQWQADLVDIKSLSKFNDGNQYILTVIDCFSKYAWAIPIKRKDSAALVEAFTKLFKDRHPKRLQTDKGKEFLNAPVQDVFKRFDVKHFVTQNETKAAMAERFNRTLKTRMFAYFTGENTNRYVDVLPELVDSYNHSVHRTIGMKPVDVKSSHTEKLWHRMYGSTVSKMAGPIKQIKAPTNVRISKAKTAFTKGYRPNWTGELFKIDKIESRAGRRVFKLKDRLGEDIAGTFYPEEIQTVVKTDKDLFLVESIIKHRTRKGIKEVLVKWKDFPDKFNSWVALKDIQNVGRT